MAEELKARLEEWSVAHVGDPLGAYYVLIGRVFGRAGLTDGNIATTSPVRFLSEDLSHAITESQNRRYELGQQSTVTLKGLRVLASTLTVSWQLPDTTTIRLNVEPQEVAGRHFGNLDG